MSVVKWNNQNIFPNINSVFDDFFNSDIRMLEAMSHHKTIPAVNILDNEENYIIELAVPGKVKEDFDINIDDGILSVSSEKQEEQESDNKIYYKKEYSYSSFQRSFNLPKEIKQDEVKAVYENGILSIELPKNEKTLAIPKSIEIK